MQRILSDAFGLATLSRSMKEAREHQAMRCSFHQADLLLDRIGGNVFPADIGITRSSFVGGGELVPSTYPSKA